MRLMTIWAFSIALIGLALLVVAAIMMQKSGLSLSVDSGQVDPSPDQIGPDGRGCPTPPHPTPEILQECEAQGGRIAPKINITTRCIIGLECLTGEPQPRLGQGPRENPLMAESYPLTK